MDSYLIYFIIFILVILLAFVIVRLLSQGFKIVYEKPTYRSFNVVKESIKKLADTNVDVRVSKKGIEFNAFTNITERIEKENKDLNFSEMRKKIRTYVVASIRDGEDLDNLKKTKSYVNNVAADYKGRSIDKNTVLVRNIIPKTYDRKNDRTIVKIDVSLEYEYRYEAGAQRNVEKTYTLEFIVPLKFITVDEKVLKPDEWYLNKFN